MNARDQHDRELTSVEEQQLLDVLGTALRSLPNPRVPRTDTAPESLIEGALWVHDWLNIDAEIAELTFDSHVGGELFTVRSTASLRWLAFVSDDHRIELEVEPGERTVGFSGQVIPVVEGSVELLVGGHLYRGEIDAHGAFVIDGVIPGTVLAFVATSGRKIRLGSFEV